MWPPFAWLEQDTGVPADELERAFRDWARTDVVLRGELVLAILRRGTEVHCVLSPSWRQRVLPGKLIGRAVGDLLTRTGGMLTTRILHASAAPLEFVARLGFKKTWSDETFHYFALTSAPFGRKHP